VSKIIRCCPDTNKASLLTCPWRQCVKREPSCWIFLGINLIAHRRRFPFRVAARISAHWYVVKDNTGPTYENNACNFPSLSITAKPHSRLTHDCGLLQSSFEFSMTFQRCSWFTSRAGSCASCDIQKSPGKCELQQGLLAGVVFNLRPVFSLKEKTPSNASWNIQKSSEKREVQQVLSWKSHSLLGRGRLAGARGRISRAPLSWSKNFHNHLWLS